MKLNKLSLAGKNLIIPDQEEFAGEGKMANLFLGIGIGGPIGGVCRLHTA
jgi:hypothetical protein